MKDLISVIVPVYNCENYIQRCIKSILNQTYTNLEIIIINDGSSDNTEKKVNEIVDSRIRYFYKKNSGVSASRNFGISIAKGEYIIFIDADDVLKTEMIETLYNNLKTNDVDVIRCNYIKEINEKKIDGEILEYFNKKLNKEDIYEKVILDILTHKLKCFVWLLLIKKDKLKSKFSEDLVILEDMLFYINLLVSIDSFMIIDERLYEYNCNNISSATKNNILLERNMKNMINATYMILHELNKNKLKENELEKFVTKNINAILNYEYMMSKNNYKINEIQQIYDEQIKENKEYKHIDYMYNKKYSNIWERVIYICNKKNYFKILSLLFIIRKKIAQGVKKYEKN